LEAVIAPSRGVAFDWAHAEVRNQKLPGCWAYSRALCPSLAGSDPAPVSAEWHRIILPGPLETGAGCDPNCPACSGQAQAMKPRIVANQIIIEYKPCGKAHTP